MNWQNYFAKRQPAMVELLRQLVEIESPSTNKAAVDRLVAFVVRQLTGLGAGVEIFAQSGAGDHVLGTWPGGQQAPPILLLLHMDTVWPVGTLKAMPWRESDGVVRGPGVYDMKASLAMALTVLRALRETGQSPARPLRLLFTSDEEIGSATSRALIEEQAGQAGLVLCMEPALPDGSLKTARKGVGEFVVTAYGRAAHAGADHSKGVNAIEELAHQILAIQALTDYASGVTLNVGTIKGGIASNIVPDQATLEVDMRVTHEADAERVAQHMAALKPVLPGTRLQVSGGLNRPPMERTLLIAQTFEKVKAIATDLGVEISEGATGGGSDANFAAPLGVPTLDGLGPVGAGAHSVDEQVELASLAPRTALLTAVLTRWA